MFQPNFDHDHFFDAFKMKLNHGLRYRDEATMARLAMQYAAGQRVSVFPLLTERSDPTLEDFDLIDALWRRDIEAEKGGASSLSPFPPQEQYERDLQLLTEKSVQAPLTEAETSRFEDISKAYFEDFYASSFLKEYMETPILSKSMSTMPPIRRSSFDMKLGVKEPESPSAPSDEDLKALFDEMAKDGGELDRALSDVNPCSSVCSSSTAERRLSSSSSVLLHNVSLSSVAQRHLANLTEVDFMTAPRPEIAPIPSLAPSNFTGVPSSGAPNSTDLFADQAQFWYLNTSEVIYDSSRERMPNMSQLVLPPLRSMMDEDAVTQLRCREQSTQEDSTASSSPGATLDLSVGGSSSSSPQYSGSGSYSEAENRVPPKSRMHGKLIPRFPYDDSNGEERDDDEASEVHHRIRSYGSAARRRGRQSKDEQLAAENRLPSSAAQIANMSLTDLQRLLKSEDLTEQQKQLIRKIRRRGSDSIRSKLLKDPDFAECSRNGE